MYSGIVAPHKYRLHIIKTLNKQLEVLGAWRKDKDKILIEYINKLKNFYDSVDTFLIFVPPTHTPIFTDDIVAKVKTEFPNSIYVNNAFSKKSGVSFGDEKFKNFSIEQLAAFIIVDSKVLIPFDSYDGKVLIVDDVHSSGKTIELTKYLIRLNLSREVDIKSGVILTTT